MVFIFLRLRSVLGQRIRDGAPKPSVLSLKRLQRLTRSPPGPPYPDRQPIGYIRYAYRSNGFRDRPCDVSTSTCRSFAMISPACERRERQDAVNRPDTGFPPPTGVRG